MAMQNILIVDDEPDLRETLKEIFEVSGFTAVTAGNGQEAFGLLEKGGAPCLVLLDLMMPVMNGWEFLNRLKSDRPQTFSRMPIIVMSAVADTTDVHRRYACEVMRKPLNIPHLLEMASRHCAINLA